MSRSIRQLILSVRDGYQDVSQNSTEDGAATYHPEGNAEVRQSDNQTKLVLAILSFVPLNPQLASHRSHIERTDINHSLVAEFNMKKNRVGRHGLPVMTSICDIPSTAPASDVYRNIFRRGTSFRLKLYTATPVRACRSIRLHQWQYTEAEHACDRSCAATHATPCRILQPLSAKA